MLSVLVLVLGAAGNAPAFQWLPEVPLLAITIVTPIAICGAAGWQVSQVLRGSRPGLVAGGMAGLIGGLTGGLFFVVIGKPIVNLSVLVGLGLASGIIAGFAGSVAARRWRRA